MLIPAYELTNVDVCLMLIPAYELTNVDACLMLMSVWYQARAAEFESWNHANARLVWRGCC
jgi:hypothetical protein